MDPVSFRVLFTLTLYLLFAAALLLAGVAVFITGEWLHSVFGAHAAEAKPLPDAEPRGPEPGRVDAAAEHRVAAPPGERELTSVG